MRARMNDIQKKRCHVIFVCDQHGHAPDICSPFFPRMSDSQVGMCLISVGGWMGVTQRHYAHESLAHNGIYWTIDCDAYCMVGYILLDGHEITEGMHYVERNQ